MNFWWVNHKQTARQEIGGGYLWSPKRESNGNFSQSYDFMRQARPGDAVVSFASAIIGYVGIVSGFPVSAPKPDEFGETGSYWSNDGWLVPVLWSRVEKPFRPKDNIEKLKYLLPEKYSPIQQNGNGNQKIYLAKIDQALFEALMNLGDFALDSGDVGLGMAADDTIIDQIEDDLQTRLEADQDLSNTEKEAIVKARRGQGIFRKNVELIEPRCRVTGLSDKRLLIASHIKPWRACETPQERLDGSNGLLLAPHVDRLFDIALITFEQDGALIVSPTISSETIECLGLSRVIEDGVGEFSSEQGSYLQHHRERFLN